MRLDTSPELELMMGVMQRMKVLAASLPTQDNLYAYYDMPSMSGGEDALVLRFCIGVDPVVSVRRLAELALHSGFSLGVTGWLHFADLDERVDQTLDLRIEFSPGMVDLESVCDTLARHLYEFLRDLQLPANPAGLKELLAQARGRI